MGNPNSEATTTVSSVTGPFEASRKVTPSFQGCLGDSSGSTTCPRGKLGGRVLNHTSAASLLHLAHLPRRLPLTWLPQKTSLRSTSSP